MRQAKKNYDMKKMLFICLCAALLASCGSAKPTDRPACNKTVKRVQHSKPSKAYEAARRERLRAAKARTFQQ